MKKIILLFLLTAYLCYSKDLHSIAGRIQKAEKNLVLYKALLANIKDLENASISFYPKNDIHTNKGTISSCDKIILPVKDLKIPLAKLALKVYLKDILKKESLFIVKLKQELKQELDK